MSQQHRVALAVAAALIIGALLAKTLIFSSAGTSACDEISRSWQGQVTGVILPDSHPVEEARIVALINAFRRAHSLWPLEPSRPLAASAREHSADMLAHGYFEHDRKGQAFTARLGQYTPAVCLAENIAWGTGGFATGPGVVSLWRASAPHRRVMLTPWLRRVGVGVRVGAFFGQPSASVVTADFST